MTREHRSYSDFFFLTCSKGWDPGRWRYSCCWKFPHSSRPSDTSLQSYVAWRTCAGPQSWPMDEWTAGACQSTLWLCWLRILWGTPAWEKQQQNCQVNNRRTKCGRQTSPMERRPCLYFHFEQEKKKKTDKNNPLHPNCGLTLPGFQLHQYRLDEHPRH